MKTNKNDSQPRRLTAESQHRLLAYTTAAGLGAFFAGQSVEAQVTASAAFAPYPATLLPPPAGGTGPYGFYHYFSIDGGAAPDFNLSINAPIPDSPAAGDSQFIDLIGQGGNGQALTPIFSPPDPSGNTTDAYLVSFLGGTTIDATTAAAPFYKNRLAISYVVPDAYGGFYNYLDSKYKTSGALGFSFIGSVDGQKHFGYMNIQVNVATNSAGHIVMQSVVVRDVYYNATPNAGITVPVVVAISSIALGDANAVTINFSSNDNADVSEFTLQSSPTLGTSASWTDDPNASISLVTAASPSRGINQATFQAVTTAAGGTSQFYRIVH